MQPTYECPRCGKRAFPGFTMGAGGKMVVQCGGCQFEDASLSPVDFSQGLAVEAGPSNGQTGWAGRTPVVVDVNGSSRQPKLEQNGQSVLSATGLPLLPEPAPTAPAFVPPAVASPGDVIGWIESRATWLAAEEARLLGQVAEANARIAGVRAESKRLGKMLRAGRALARADARRDPPSAQDVPSEMEH